MTSRPMRSALYVPASNGRAIEKAAGLPADAVILDLEDAVAPDAKTRARDALRGAGGPARQLRAVRVNGAGTPWHEGDVEAAVRLAPDAIVLPKTGGAADVAALAERLEAMGSSAAIWAMVETPQGVLSAAEIAGAPRVAALVMGTNDLVRELGARHVPGRAPVAVALGLCVLAARARGIACLDGVSNALRDEAALRAECEAARDMGMDGKTLIHPAQIAAANEVFAPSAEEVERARAEVEAFEKARSDGRGVAVLDGRMVEGLHVETARAILARAEAIAGLEDG